MNFYLLVKWWQKKKPVLPCFSHTSSLLLPDIFTPTMPLCCITKNQLFSGSGKEQTHLLCLKLDPEPCWCESPHSWTTIQVHITLDWGNQFLNMASRDGISRLLYNYSPSQQCHYLRNTPLTWPIAALNHRWRSTAQWENQNLKSLRSDASEICPRGPSYPISGIRECTAQTEPWKSNCGRYDLKKDRTCGDERLLFIA